MLMQRRTLLRSIALMAGAIMGSEALAQDAENDMLTISGELAYLVRVALPLDSVATVELRDAQPPADAPPVAEARIALNGKQVPIPFSVSVKKSQLQPDRIYHLHGAIHVGSLKRWSLEAVLIDPEQGEIDLRTMFLLPAETETRLTPVTMDAIVDTEWVVEDIDGRGIIDSSRVSVRFATDGSVSGHASCNRYSTSWTEANGKLKVGPAATTRMACAEALMDQEQKFLSILADVRLYATTPEGALVLQTIDGRKLHAFPAG